MTNCITPSIAFNDLVSQIPKGSHENYNRIKELTDDQVRYALWCAVMMAFGSPSSNFPLVILTEVTGFEYMKEAQLILARLGLTDEGYEIVKANLDR